MHILDTVYTWVFIQPCLPTYGGVLGLGQDLLVLADSFSFTE